MQIFVTLYNIYALHPNLYSVKISLLIMHYFLSNTHIHVFVVSIPYIMAATAYIYD